ncbi:MAG: hypothetical protein M3O34_10460 [Chloroflexota bacterium]|nr:hypothetical protein [Chloroflexota bacterium]
MNVDQETVRLTVVALAGVIASLLTGAAGVLGGYFAARVAQRGQRRIADESFRREKRHALLYPVVKLVMDRVEDRHALIDALEDGDVERARAATERLEAAPLSQGYWWVPAGSKLSRQLYVYMMLDKTAVQTGLVVTLLMVQARMLERHAAGRRHVAVEADHLHGEVDRLQGALQRLQLDGALDRHRVNGAAEPAGAVDRAEIDGRHRGRPDGKQGTFERGVPRLSPGGLKGVWTDEIAGLDWRGDEYGARGAALSERCRAALSPDAAFLDEAAGVDLDALAEEVAETQQDGLALVSDLGAFLDRFVAEIYASVEQWASGDET